MTSLFLTFENQNIQKVEFYFECYLSFLRGKSSKTKFFSKPLNKYFGQFKA